ncbi:anion exchange protein 3-like [Montipora capricornis]|uniref:anion exchange protein 3-like n=1 Tax=Montipora capricornis TaxID=246305 RepID=UPI0035F1D268
MEISNPVSKTFSIHSFHEGFVELEELVSTTDRDLVWKERARWIKLEEDVEESVNRWGKPHIPCLTFRSLKEVETNIRNGVLLLDLEGGDLPNICEDIIWEIKMSNRLSRDECDAVRMVLLTRHEHQYQKKRVRAKSIARRISQIMPQVQRQRITPNQNHRPVMESPQVSPTNPKELGANQLLTDFAIPVAAHFLDDKTDPADQAKKTKGSDIRNKLPKNAQATTVLVGGHEELSCVVSAFIRFASGCDLGDFAEVSIPVRFMFIMLGPEDVSIDYHEVGRSVATLMSDKVFLESAYNAQSRQDLLDALASFLEDSVMIPPGEWDRNLLTQTVPILADQSKQLASDRRRRGAVNSNDVRKNTLREVQQEIVDDPLSRTGKFCGGLVRDVKRRLPFYVSDFTDALDVHCIPTIIFVYFACLAPAVAFGGLLNENTDGWMGVTEMIVATALSGILFSLFAGQPLIIIGATGPILVFEKITFHLCEHYGIEYLPWRAWVGIWVMIICFIIVAFEGCFLINYFTRFTEEIFALMISIIFIYDAINYLIQIFDTFSLQDDNNTLRKIQNESTSNTALFSLILMVGTFSVAFSLRKLRHSHFFGPKTRYIVSDFGVFFAIVAMVMVDYLTEGVYTEKLQVADGLSVTSPNRRNWLCNPMGVEQPMSAGSIFAAFIPAILVSILIFMEVEFTGVILDKKDHKLKKGMGYNLDLFVLALMVGLCSILGLPWMCATPVHTLSHFHALKVMSTNHAPGEHACLLEVREQRLTNILIHLLIGLTVLLFPVLRLIPISVLFGVFLFLGVSSMSHIQLVERIKLLFIPASLHPGENYVTNVKTAKMHLFTVIQMCCVCTLVIIKLTEAAPAFPFFIICMIPLRKLLERVFSSKELEALDTEVEDCYDSDMDEYDSIHVPI